ncbi:MAG: hypothetical protein ACYDA6_11780 [Solirubrobacteraceae bacterium]
MTAQEARQLDARALGLVTAPWTRRAAKRARALPHPRLVALAAYVALSLVTMGWRILPDPAASCACQGNDPTFFVWALAWWPHALLHGLDPLYSHYVWYPVGVNIARVTSMPSVALALTPVTLLFGPLVSYNVVTLASPVLAAFTCYLLCRRIVGRELPALAAGYLFGFGAYEFPQLVGHPNLAVVFLIPVVVHLVLRRLEREISGRVFVPVLAALLLLQLGISTEVLTTAVMLGFALLVVARIGAKAPYAERIDQLLAEVVAAGWLAVLVAAPFLYDAVIKGGLPSEAIGNGYNLDLLNPVFPTSTTWFGGHAFHALTSQFEGGAFAEANGYLSLPLLCAFTVWARHTRRRVLAKMLLAAAAVSFLAALGGRLHVAGTETVPMPFALIGGLPLIKLLTPSRIAMYTSLAVAIGVAAWLAESVRGSRRARTRWLVFGLGAFMVFPNLGGELWSYPPPPPVFFRTGLYRRYLVPGETLLALSYAQNGTSMAWQAECGFCFRMPEGYLGHTGVSQITSQQVVGELGANREVNPRLLASFLVRYDIRDIVIDKSKRILSPYPLQFAALGLRGIAVGGVWVFHVTPEVIDRLATSPPGR